MEIFFNVAMMLLKCFYIFIWVAGFKMCLCQRRIALGDESEGKRYLVYFVKSQYSKADYDSWLCGGALVSPTQILTAAACLVEMNRIYAIAGYKKYVSNKDINNDTCTRMRKQKVVKIYVPKEYKVSPNNPAVWMNVDIGVAVVGKPYNFSDFTYRVDCSYEPQSIFINYDLNYEQENTHAVVFGWGGTRARNPNDTSQLDINSEVLQEASTVIVNKTICAKPATNDALRQILNKYLLCASGHGKLDGEGLDKTLSSDTPDECPGGRRYDLTKCVDDGFDFRRGNTGSHENDKNNTSNGKRNGTRANRRSSPGICQNDHGGPLITWVGLQEMLIGVALNSIYNHNYECVGPFLYVSTAGTAKIIKCLLELDPDERELCNQQVEDERYKVEEIVISWPEDTIKLRSEPEFQEMWQQKPLFKRQGNDESPLQMRPTKDIEPTVDELGRPIPPAPQKEGQQGYEMQGDQKLSQPYDPSQNQQQLQMQGQPNVQNKEQQQPYEPYGNLYEPPRDDPSMQSYNPPKDTQQRADSYDPQNNNQPQPESINQRQIQSMNQPQLESQKYSQGQSYNQQQKEPNQFESYNAPQFDSFNDPQMQSYNQPQMQSFTQPQMQSYNQPQMQSYNQPQMQSYNQQQMQSFNQPQMQSFNQPQIQTLNQPQKQPPVQSMNQQQSQLMNPPPMQSYNNPQIKTMQAPSIDSFNPGEIPSFSQPQTNSFKLPIVEPYKPPPPMDPYKQLSFDSFNPSSFNPAPAEPFESHFPTLDQPDLQQNAEPPAPLMPQTPLQTFEQSQVQPSNPLREGRDPTFDPSFDLTRDDQQPFDPVYSQFQAPMIEPIPSQAPPEQTFEELYKTLHDPESPQDQAFDHLRLGLARDQSPREESLREEAPHEESPRENPSTVEPRTEETPTEELPRLEPHDEQPHDGPPHDVPPHDEPPSEAPPHKDPPNEDAPHVELPSEQPTIEKPFEPRFDEPFELTLDSNEKMTDFPYPPTIPDNSAHEQPTEQQDDVKVRPQVPLDFQIDYGGALNSRR